MKSVLLMLIASASTFASIGEPAVVWKTKAPIVCWATAGNWTKSSVLELGDPSLIKKYIKSFDEKQKKLIAEAVNKNFTMNSAGIQFQGWRDCSATPEADIYIIRAQTTSLGGGMATIGQNGESVCNESFTSCGYKTSALNKKSFVLLNTIPNKYKTTSDETLSMLAIHEFGHVAGLRHEHARPEAAQDTACKEMNYWFDDQENDSTVRFSAYDTSSFMSYCYMFKIFHHGLSVAEHGMQLSPADLNSLRCLYSYKDEEFARNCRLH